MVRVARHRHAHPIYTFGDLIGLLGFREEAPTQRVLKASIRFRG
jgi:hypothetical protein